MPVPGVVFALDQMDAVMEIRNAPSERRGLSTGFAKLDDLMTISPGYLSIVTGIPSSGKSEVVDAIAVNMAHLHGWRFVFYSPENYPVSEHIKKLVEKYHGKNLRAMTHAEIDAAVKWVHRHFTWLYPPDTAPSLPEILKLVGEVKAVRKIQGLVIDPWNEVCHEGQGGQRDDQYLSRQLSVLRRHNREHGIHTFVVAHPVKMQKDLAGQYQPPTTYEILGGSMWRNKADYAWCAHRHDMSKNEVAIYVQKVKYKWMGRVGMVTMDYDYQSGRLKDQGARGFALPAQEAPM